MSGKGLSVAVVGGGLAGLTAALDCADAGASVALFESRPRLGGATFSIVRDGRTLDNGQHIALRCCTEYRGLLRRLAVESSLELQPRLSLPVLSPRGRPASLTRNGLPAPLHLAASLLRYSHLSPLDRLRSVRAVEALRALDPGDPALDGETFASWLERHGQSRRAVDALWNLITLPTINLPAAEASLLLAVTVFRVGLLDESDACDLAVPRVPLQRLHGDPAGAELRRLGAEIHLRTRVRAVVPGPSVQLADGPRAFDRVIVAVPHQVAPALLPPGVVGDEVATGLGASPIVNVHLHFDRRVLEHRVAAAVDSPVQYVFDRSAAAGVEQGQLLSISISHATRELELPQEALVEQHVAALGELLPRVRGAALLGADVTREPRATFAGVPGTQRLRPGARTELPGIYLAGAWTDTGWPATMEGAVRSGHAAAAAALAEPSRHVRRTEAA
ncbi:MAG TPA: hydroxysqualene dehydroxylase HpnE [Gaiellaceae bacterium]|nr:hydroxysqualene dehydroxylase HpnE [Gaiellaceae bacterium]